MYLLPKVNLIQSSLRYTYNGCMSYLISTEVYTIKEVMILLFPITVFMVTGAQVYLKPHALSRTTARPGVTNVCVNVWMTTMSQF